MWLDHNSQNVSLLPSLTLEFKLHKVLFTIMLWCILLCEERPLCAVIELHTALYTAQCTLHCTQHNAHCTVHSIMHTPLYTAQCTLLCTLNTVHSKLPSAFCTLHSTRYTVHSTLYNVHSALYTVHSWLPSWSSLGMVAWLEEVALTWLLLLWGNVIPAQPAMAHRLQDTNQQATNQHTLWTGSKSLGMTQRWNSKFLKTSQNLYN